MDYSDPGIWMSLAIDFHLLLGIVRGISPYSTSSIFFFSGGHCRSWCFLWSHFPSRNPGTDCDASVASKIARAAIHMFAQTQTHAWLPVDSGFSTFAIFLRLRRSTRITQTHTDHADTHGSRRRTRITQTHGSRRRTRRHTRITQTDTHADTHGSRSHTRITQTAHAYTHGSRRPHTRITQTYTDHAHTHGPRRRTRITHTHGSRRRSTYTWMPASELTAHVSVERLRFTEEYVITVRY